MTRQGKCNHIWSRHPSSSRGNHKGDIRECEECGLIVKEDPNKKKAEIRPTHNSLEQEYFKLGQEYEKYLKNTRDAFRGGDPTSEQLNDYIKSCESEMSMSDNVVEEIQ